MIQTNGCFKSKVIKEDESPKEPDHSYINTIVDECTEISARKLEPEYDPVNKSVNVYEKPDFIPQSPPVYEQLNVQQTTEEK